MIQLPRLGAHMSIAGGILNALSDASALSCTTMALFSGSPRVWKHRMPEVSEATQFKHAARTNTISPIILHAPYLINIASDDSLLRQRSIQAMSFEIEFASLLGLSHIVLHPGSHGGRGLGQGIRLCAQALDELLASNACTDVGIALEVMPGSGHTIGGTFEHLRDIIAASRDERRLSVCLDSCHLFASGYDIRDQSSWNSTLERCHSTIGIDTVSVFHMNDSRFSLGSRRDNHTHIGRGEIGLLGFEAMLNDPRIRHLPMILETPKGPHRDMDAINLTTLRSLLKERT